MPDFTVRNAFGYQAQIPTGDGWAAPAATEYVFQGGSRLSLAKQIACTLMESLTPDP